MAIHTRSMFVAAAAGALLAGCAYDYDYRGNGNGYGYGAGYDYAPGYYGGPEYYSPGPTVGFGFAYSDRDRRDWRGREGSRERDGWRDNDRRGDRDDGRRGDRDGGERR